MRTLPSPSPSRLPLFFREGKSISISILPALLPTLVSSAHLPPWHPSPSGSSSTLRMMPWSPSEKNFYVTLQSPLGSPPSFPPSTITCFQSVLYPWGIPRVLPHSSSRQLLTQEPPRFLETCWLSNPLTFPQSLLSRDLSGAPGSCLTFLFHHSTFPTSLRCLPSYPPLLFHVTQHPRPRG